MNDIQYQLMTFGNFPCKNEFGPIFRDLRELVVRVKTKISICNYYIGSYMFCYEAAHTIYKGILTADRIEKGYIERNVTYTTISFLCFYILQIR